MKKLISAFVFGIMLGNMLLANLPVVFAEENNTDSTTIESGVIEQTPIKIPRPQVIFPNTPITTTDTENEVATPESKEISPTTEEETEDAAVPTEPSVDAKSATMMSTTLAAEDDSVIESPVQNLSYDPFNSIKNLSGQHNVNEFTGDLNYSYPLYLPAARGLQPILDIRYATSASHEFTELGSGWELSIPKISRFTRGGSFDLYADNLFISNYFAGGNGELVPLSIDATGHGTYQQKVFAGEYKFTFNQDNSWTVIAPDGTQYIYGNDNSARVESEDGSKIHDWYLTKITDTSGNTIDYSYTKSQGNVYLKNINYGDSQNPYEIRLEPYYSGTITQFPDLPSYKTGFPLVNKKELLKNIIVRDPFSSANLNYSLTYTQNQFINFLSSIQLIGKDASGTTLTLQPTTFNYESYKGERSLPITFPEGARFFDRYQYSSCSGCSANFRFALFVDYNNDGWLDIINKYGYCVASPCSTVSESVYINNGALKWSEETAKPNIPRIFFYSGTNQAFLWLQTLDLNGDNNNEFVQTKGRLNNGDLLIGNIIPVIDQNNSNMYSYLMLDIDGDNLTDYVNVGDGSLRRLRLNTGNGFKDILDAGGNPMNINGISQADWSAYYDKGGLQIMDINGDNIDDFVISDSNEDVYRRIYKYKKIIFLGDGFGNFIDYSDKLNFPFYIHRQGYYDNDYHLNERADFDILDLNRDGLVDLGMDSYPRMVYINNGSIWIDYSIYMRQSIAYNPKNDIYNYWPNWDKRDYQGGFEFIDLNYDTVLDQIVYDEDAGAHPGPGPWEYIRPGAMVRTSLLPDVPVLQKVTNPLGSILNFEYTPASSYIDASGNPLNPELPQARLTLSKVTAQDGLGSSSVTTYSYTGGKLYRPKVVKGIQKQEFQGFRNVTKILPDSSKIVSQYLQGTPETNFASKGLLERSQVYTAGGTLLQESSSKFQTVPMSSLGYQTQVTSSIGASYNSAGNSNQASAIAYTYDQHGNVTQATDYGEVSFDRTQNTFSDIGTDLLKTNIGYAYNSAKNLFTHPSQTTTRDQSNQIVAEAKYSYDGLAEGSVDKGLLTQIDKLVQNGTYLTSKAQYNNFGQIVKTTNPRGFETTFTYDQSNLFPTVVQNSQGQTTQYAYSYLFGTPTRVTDPNGAQNEVILDALGRPIEKRVSSPLNNNQLARVATFAYNLGQKPAQIKSTAFAGHDNIEIESYSYLDGFGRTIQSRQEAEGSNFVVASKIYDAKGRLQKELLPVFAGGTSFSAINANALSNTYTYDALDRVTSVTNSLGTASTSYDRWRQIIVDSNHHPKDLIFDARGNLIEVREYLGGQAYSTYYQYSPLGNLTRITDAAGNIKNLTYDLLERKLHEEDLHLPADNTFGVWDYIYDNNSNLTQATDPRGEIVNYSYDSLDRLSKETHQNVEKIKYFYDTGINGVGRLAQVVLTQTGGDTSKNFDYNILGNVSKQKLAVASEGASYEMSYKYDALGNLLELEYPDNLVVKNTYNNAGQLDAIRKNDQFILVENIDYSPVGTWTKIKYGNNVITENTYDPNQLYRLTKKETTSGNSKIQSLSYTFDPVGNLLTLNESSDTDLARVASYEYDALDRLTKATVSGAAGGENYIQNYSYDILGNILNKSDVGAYEYAGGTAATAALVFSNPHAVTKAGTKAFTYDKSGNLSNDGTFTHTWNYKNQLSESSSANRAIKYSYDESGQRYLKDSAGKKTIYLNRYFENDAGSPSNYIYAGDLKIATIAKITENQSSNQRPGANQPSSVSGSCTDTDGGKDYNTRGTATGSNYGRSDECYDPNVGVVPSCSGELCAIEEFYCGADNKAYLDLNYFACPNGCENGACLPAPQASLHLGDRLLFASASMPDTGLLAQRKLLAQAAPTCTDSDGGANYDIQGSTQGINYSTPQADSCYDANSGRIASCSGETCGLEEFVCGDDGKAYLDLKYNICTNGCQNGACKAAPAGGGGGGGGGGRGGNTIQISTKIIYHHSDHLSGASVDTDSNGAILETIDYYPFGSTRLDTQSSYWANDYKYTGKELDSDTGLYYYGARYYDASLGRFISVDPWGGDITDPQSLNKYSYVQNNPLKYVDPEGRVAETAWDLGNFGWDIARVVKNGIEGFAGAVVVGYGAATGNDDIVQAGLDSLNQTAQDLKETAVDAATDAVATAIPFVPAGMTKLTRAADKAADAAKVVDKAGDIKKAVVIGEDMVKRVNPAAKSIGAETITDWMTRTGKEWSLKVNKEWTDYVKNTGKQVIDIGPDFGARLGKFKDGIQNVSKEAYNLERKSFKDYGNYQKSFTRSGKFFGK